MYILQGLALLHLRDVAAGVSYLHKRNVLHGDLKLANVLLQRSSTSRSGYVGKVCGATSCMNGLPRRRARALFHHVLSNLL